MNQGVFVGLLFGIVAGFGIVWCGTGCGSAAVEGGGVLHAETGDEADASTSSTEAGSWTFSAADGKPDAKYSKNDSLDAHDDSAAPGLADARAESDGGDACSLPPRILCDFPEGLKSSTDPAESFCVSQGVPYDSYAILKLPACGCVPSCACVMAHWNCPMPSSTNPGTMTCTTTPEGFAAVSCVYNR